MSALKHIVDALASIGAVHPRYRGATGNAIRFIEQLEAENAELKAALAAAEVDVAERPPTTQESERGAMDNE